eukprot:Lithocolla_globosa_v1_NODE_58_length_7390_cov_243.140014.p6 type:complete len:137 gc:universal NODE_58_length_7390_cov_243.140014:4512-4102(-)
MSLECHHHNLKKCWLNKQQVISPSHPFAVTTTRLCLYNTDQPSFQIYQKQRPCQLRIQQHKQTSTDEGFQGTRQPSPPIVHCPRICLRKSPHAGHPRPSLTREYPPFQPTCVDSHRSATHRHHSKGVTTHVLGLHL